MECSTEGSLPQGMNHPFLQHKPCTKRGKHCCDAFWVRKNGGVGQNPPSFPLQSPSPPAQKTPPPPPSTTTFNPSAKTNHTQPKGTPPQNMTKHVKTARANSNLPHFSCCPPPVYIMMRYGIVSPETPPPPQGGQFPAICGENTVVPRYKCCCCTWASLPCRC